MAVVELGYFTIGVADVSRALKFYGALFGWEFGDVSDAYAHVSNTVLPFGLRKDAPADLSSFYFRVGDMKAMVTRVKDLGGTPGDIQDYPSGLNSVCKDDQGTTFSLWQPAAGY